MLAFLLDPAALSGPADGASDMHPTRQRLISVATRLFQQRGYHAIGLAEILALSETPQGVALPSFPGRKARIGRGVRHPDRGILACRDRPAVGQRP
jgi:TetR/AcrR family transcriptional repressor of lmrAB and yxaGH operons